MDQDSFSLFEEQSRQTEDLPPSFPLGQFSAWQVDELSVRTQGEGLGLLGRNAKAFEGSCSGVGVGAVPDILRP